MSHLILSHLSKNNNKPELVDQLFRKHAGGINIVVASRNKETEVFFIDGPQAPIRLLPKRSTIKSEQLSLF